MSRLIIEDAYVLTNDPDRSEYASGHVVVLDNKIAAVGEGPAAADLQGRRVDGSGCLVTPGLADIAVWH